jgi:hypothetical protein
MTPLRPGVGIVNAPRFQATRPWPDRLRINSGVVIDGSRILPRDDWRPLTPEELALVTGADGDPAAALALFNIPERLRAQWWTLADDDPASSAAFSAFAAEILEYLQFKRLPLPPVCAFAVMIQAPGQPSTHPDLGGLTAEPPGGPVLGGINLGDEASAVVFLNLGPAQFHESAEPPPARARAFLTTYPDYPLVQLALQPGEGFWLPHGPLILDGDTRGRTEIDVRLEIRPA